jgi:hypothetical protein
MPVRRPICVMRVAISCPMMCRPMMPARMAAAMARILIGGRRNFGARGRRTLVLATGIHALPRGTMTARHRAEQGQALIIRVRRLNFLTIIDRSRSGVRTSGGRDQRGGENTVQYESQGFIL